MDQDLGLCLLTIEFPPPSPETAREASQHVMTIRLMTEKDSPPPGSFAGLPSSLGQAPHLAPKSPCTSQIQPWALCPSRTAWLGLWPVSIGWWVWLPMWVRSPMWAGPTAVSTNAGPQAIWDRTQSRHEGNTEWIHERLVKERKQLMLKLCRIDDSCHKSWVKRNKEY